MTIIEMDLTCPSPSLPFIVHSNLTLNSMNQGVQGKQSSTDQDNTFFNEELPLVGLEPTTLCFPGRALFLLSYMPGQLRRQGSKSTTQHNTCTVCSHHYRIHTSTKLTSTPFTPSHHPFTPSHHPFTPPPLTPALHSHHHHQHTLTPSTHTAGDTAHHECQNKTATCTVFANTQHTTVKSDWHIFEKN